MVEGYWEDRREDRREGCVSQGAIESARRRGSW